MRTITYEVRGEKPSPSKTNEARGIDVWMKDQARFHSSVLRDAGDKVGPECRFLQPPRYPGQKRLTIDKLDKTRLCFGVKAPEDGKGGGWAGLVTWRWIEEASGEGYGIVKLDMERAASVGADAWLEDFVKRVLKLCKWRVVKRSEDGDGGNAGAATPH